MKKLMKKISTIILCVCLIVGMVPVSALKVEAVSNITVYSQTDSRWANTSYGVGPDGKVATISSAGCGILSYVNAVYYMTGNFISPIELADWSVKNGYRVDGVGTAWRLYKAYANRYGETYNFKYAGKASTVSETKIHL